MTVKLLAFAGSTRTGSLNQALVDLAAREARARGAEVTAIRLTDFDLPIYHGDLEPDEFPAAALELQTLLRAHHGLLIASPEHNGTISALLKNSIDWGSRPVPGHAIISGFRNKVAGIMGASISPFGTLRSLTHLRHVLSTIQTIVATEQVMIPFAATAFDAQGALKEPLPAQLMGMMVARVIDLAERLEPPVS
ncbi:NAD(P)H-dependent oxidoreductase [Phenylobacterium sp.]|uniref:NADPH-dependent FMN reductase n=1 Tax=Phenylobacterium sp. TaxID=1871053 RepID=UPI0025E8FB07|nr:NAD(P)H-dependent oxidoreductase [Phenylobacterium sp.]